MKRFIETYNNENFDIIIIGGGISGAAAAYDAACRGLKVALVEKNDFGSATSAATSKLIHGGLRYLANLEFGLVRESLKERRILSDIAPNYVYPIPIMIPGYEDNKYNKWKLKSGMMLYDLLSFDKGHTKDDSKKIPNHISLTREEVLKLEPALAWDNLSGAIIYYDCINIFPERLTLAFIKSAVNYGASVSNYSKVEDFIYKDSNIITGVKVRDLINNKLAEINGTLTINCAGPWADIVLNLAKKDSPHHQIRRSEGIHIITKKIFNKHIVAFATPEGQHFFIIPWRGFSIIGTTDKDYTGNPGDYSVKKESIEELLLQVNRSLKGIDLKYSDVIHCYGGLRPLVESQTKNSYESSRKYEIFDNSADGIEGLITVEGGKYTTSRHLAEKVIDVVRKKIDKKLKKTITDKEYLYGSEINDIKTFLEKIKSENKDFDERTIEYLGKNYGTQYKEILNIAKEKKILSVPLNNDGEILAQVVYAIRNEMALTLSDIVLRRTGIGTLGDPGGKTLRKVASIAAKESGWSILKKYKEYLKTKKQLQVPD